VGPLGPRERLPLRRARADRGHADRPAWPS